MCCGMTRSAAARRRPGSSSTILPDGSRRFRPSRWRSPRARRPSVRGRAGGCDRKRRLHWIPGIAWAPGAWGWVMSELTLIVRGQPVRCLVERAGEEFEVRIGEAAYRIRLVGLEPGVLIVVAEGRMQTVRIARDNALRFLYLDGRTLEYTVAQAGDPGARARPAAREDLAAPMPGGVTQVLVRKGEEVTVGQPLVIVEAMKMEH